MFDELPVSSKTERILAKSLDEAYEISKSLYAKENYSKLEPYFEKEYYEFFPENEVVGKWLLTVEEIHRANGGNWKDFPEDLK